MNESLISRLGDSPGATMELAEQYRMNSEITDLANKITYNGKLQCANTQVANATINIPNLKVREILS